MANGGGDTVSVINGQTNKRLATIPVGVGPPGVAADPNTNTAYVANAATPRQSQQRVGSRTLPGLSSIIATRRDPAILRTIARERGTRLGIYGSTVALARVAVGDPVEVEP